MLNFWPIGAGSFLQGFHRFFTFKNDSKLFYELLRPIPSHTEVPHIFEKIVIALIRIHLGIWKTEKNIQSSTITIIFLNQIL